MVDDSGELELTQSTSKIMTKFDSMIVKPTPIAVVESKKTKMSARFRNSAAISSRCWLDVVPSMRRKDMPFAIR